MVMVNFSLEMEVIIKVIGKIIKCMDMENYIIKMVRLPIKVNGLMINLMEKEEYLMIIHRMFLVLLIIMTLLI